MNSLDGANDAVYIDLRLHSYAKDMLTALRCHPAVLKGISGRASATFIKSLKYVD